MSVFRIPFQIFDLVGECQYNNASQGEKRRSWSERRWAGNFNIIFFKNFAWQGIVWRGGAEHGRTRF